MTSRGRANATPVIVGVAELRSNRGRTVAGAREPLDLLESAVRAAVLDAGPASTLLQAVDRIDVVHVSSWDYEDLPGDLAGRLGIVGATTQMSDPGGNQPVRLVDEIAARIVSGDTRVAVLGGAESFASVVAFGAAAQEPAWSRRPGGVKPPSPEQVGSEQMRRYGFALPVRAYPLYENALRHALGQSFAESQRWSAEMYSDYSSVAAEREVAWHPEVRAPEEIETVGPTNRLVCWPYPLLMNAFLNVDQAAAVVMTDVATASEYGVSPERMVHVWAGAGSADSSDLLHRTSFARAPGMYASLDSALGHAGLAADAVEVIDLYSCFPVVPKLAALHLELPRETRTSVTGGLTSFGGAGSNYCSHAVVAVVQAIRSGAKTGLVYGNGEYLTKHHSVVLGREALAAGYVGCPAPVRPSETKGPPVIDVAEGEAALETWTVEFDRHGHASLGLAIGRRSSGERFPALVRNEDSWTLGLLTDPAIDPIGRSGFVEHIDGLNFVSLAR